LGRAVSYPAVGEPHSGISVMAKKKSKRENVWLECTECKQRNYRTNVSVAEGAPKLELKKFCKQERKHTVHKLRRK
jgi:large subunit ribosomal protein L33